MPPLVIPDTWQMTWFWTNGGTPYAQNVLHLDSSAIGDPTQSFIDGIAIDVTASFNDTTGGAAALRAQLADEVVMVNIGIRDISLPNLPMLLNSNGTVVAGQAATDPLPAGNALVTTLRTNKAGRSYRGRTYVPGFAEGTNSSQGLALAAVVAAQQNAFRELMERMNARNTPLVVASRKNLETYGVITTSTNTKWDVQRRRSRNL